ncbi:MAG: hypothetical protein NZM03_02305 [Limisphaera sp.]|nr:hypothetical protein [Limisphaera sp.]
MEKVVGGGYASLIKTLRILVFLASLGSSAYSPAAVFVVNHAGDSGAGSLRQAILDAESNPGADSIHFAIPGAGTFSIALQSPLPAIREPLRIDGSTQPGYAGAPRIELNGAGAGPNAHGLYLLTSNCLVRALGLVRFSGDGIRIEYGGSNIVEGCWIGVTLDGKTAAPNSQGGITIRSSGNRVGGPSPHQRNVISGGNQGGIFLLDSMATGNMIQGNYIGLDAGGTQALGNLQNGILISAAAGNVIGGLNPGEGNVVSGNGQAGIYLMYPTAVFNRIQGNLIGTDATGRRSLGNLFGVVIVGGTSNIIGGVEPAAANVISGNRSNGVHITLGPGGGGSWNQVAGNRIGTDLNGAQALSNRGRGLEIHRGLGNRIGPGNIISGNELSGVAITGAGATSNTIVGNYIGTDSSGAIAIPNQYDGILLVGVSNNVVGGPTAEERNIIAGNLGHGIFLSGATCRSNQLWGNYIGTDRTGRQPLGNALSGVRVEGPGNQIGAPQPNAGNLISANLENGIFLVERSASNNVIAGNIIGLDASGNVPMGNQVAGIGLTNAPDNQIGGVNPGAGNLISGNADSGIYLIGPWATRNRIEGNFIGTDRTGRLARGNGRDGITGYDAPTNTVGGNVPGARNLISGNAWNGLYLTGPHTRGWVIQGNWIGIQSDGWSPLGNFYHNLEFLTNSSHHLIGGIDPEAANRIAWARGNGWDGIRIRAGSTNVTILGNAIFSNGGAAPTGLGIDLGNDGVTPNDACDADTGANLQQNFPVLTQAVASATALIVKGWIDARPNHSYTLWFYGNPTNEPSGHGEGMWPLGHGLVTTDASCKGAFSLSLPLGGSVPAWVTATATDSAGNTSEFSQSIAIQTIPRLEILPAQTGSGLIVRWPASTSGLQLQQTTNLAPPILWQSVSQLPTLQNGWYHVTVLPTDTARFYRLLLP